MKQRSKNAFLAMAANAVLFLAASNAIAQHCPFDGGDMIVVQLTDAEDKPLFGSAADLTLQELGNPDAAASCSRTGGLVSRAFLPPIDAFVLRYRYNGSSAAFTELCSDCAFNADGFYAVILGLSERTCMTKKEGETDYRYVKRKFEVRYKRDNVEQTVAVPPDKIHNMCTGTGKWSRFEPIKLRLRSSPATIKIEN